VFLGNIKLAFEKNPKLVNLLLDPFFREAVQRCQKSWRIVVSQAALLGIPTPCFSTALAFYDGYRCERLPANLIQVIFTPSHFEEAPEYSEGIEELQTFRGSKNFKSFEQYYRGTTGLPVSQVPPKGDIRDILARQSDYEFLIVTQKRPFTNHSRSVFIKNINNSAQPDSWHFCFNDGKWLASFSGYQQTRNREKRETMKVFLPIGYLGYIYTKNIYCSDKIYQRYENPR